MKNKQNTIRKYYGIRTLTQISKYEIIGTELILMRSNLKTLIYLITQINHPL